VLRALLDANLLPKVITGTSAGSLSASLTRPCRADIVVAAFACCYTEDELRKLLTPELARRINACEESIRVWMPRFLRTGARFDSTAWAAKAMFFTRGSMTFREAFERTGRVLNGAHTRRPGLADVCSVCHSVRRSSVESR